jgi:hypothetical protein
MKLGENWLTRRISSGDSFQSAASPEVLFATNRHDRIGIVRVHWPNRSPEEWHNIPVTGKLILTEGRSSVFELQL